MSINSCLRAQSTPLLVCPAAKLSRHTLNIDLEQADQKEETYDSQTSLHEKRKGRIVELTQHNSLLKFFHPVCLIRSVD